MAMKVQYTVVDGEVLAETRNGIWREYVPDPLGSTVALLDNTQTPTDTFSYWPYGEQQARTGSTPTPFQFVGTAGYYTDSPSSTYVRMRHLNTQQGRWLTQDPIYYASGDTNFYRYVRNKAISAIDYYGLKNCTDTCKDLNSGDCSGWNAHHGEVGTVICADGKPCACVMTQRCLDIIFPRNFSSKKAEQCFLSCTAVHEKVHLGDCVCTVQNGYCYVPCGRETSECKAYSTGAQCLLGCLADCQGEFNCYDDIWGQLCGACNNARNFCGNPNVNIPAPWLPAVCGLCEQIPPEPWWPVY